LLSISPRVIEALHGHRDSDANLSRVVTQEQERRRGVSPDGVDCVGVSNKPLLVELVRRYSKHDGTWSDLERLLKVLDRPRARAKPAEAMAPPPPRYKLDQRLDAETIAQLVADYEAGASSIQLGREYGMSKTSVLRLLHEAGATIRRQGLTPEQIEQAISLYAGGLSLVQVGAELNADRTTIWLALKASGMTLRSPNEPGRRRG